MSPGLSLFAPLWAMHLLADFVLPGGDLAAARRERPGRSLLLHAGILLAAGAALRPLGGIGWGLVLAAAGAHLALDGLEVGLERRLGTDWQGWSFLAGQAAHALALWGLVGRVAPLPLAAATLQAPLPRAAAAWLAAGVGLLVVVGAQALVGGALDRIFPQDRTARPAGRYIGMLERAAILLLVVMEQPAGLGFVVAAKSLARFPEINREPAFAEKFLVGTLLSALVGLAGGLAARALLAAARAPF